MKRPLCLASLIITAIIYLYLEFTGAKELVDYSELSDGKYISVIGEVTDKGIKRGFLGENIPIIYVSPGNSNIRKDIIIQCEMTESGYVEPFIGEIVKVTGNVRLFKDKRNPGEFDSRLYYSTLKIAYTIKNAQIVAEGVGSPGVREMLYRFRNYLESTLDKTLDYQDSAVMKAILLGDKTYMDEEIKDLYKNSGIIHILAVSGLHISIIGMGINKLLRKTGLPMGAAALLSIAFMYFYGIMCGMSSSATRAIVMFSVRLLAGVVGRTYDILTSLSLVEIMLVIDNPLLIYNSGFLFSFGAIIGIVVVKPLISPAIYDASDEKMRFVDESGSKPALRSFLSKAADGFLTCISVMIVTLPIYTSFYYTYPLSSIFLNLLILPFMGMLLMLGMSCLILGMISAAIGSVPGAFIHLILLFYKTACSVGFFHGRLTWYTGYSDKYRVELYIAFITIFVVALNRLRKRTDRSISQRQRITFEISKVIFIFFCMMILTFKIPPEFEINMIDVGQGDGIVLSSGNVDILIDGGSTSKKNVGKYQIEPFLKYKGIGQLDAVIITHEDQDHISGVMELFEDMEKGGIRVKMLILPEIADDSKGDNYYSLEKAAVRNNVPILYINCGEKLNIGGLELFCLNPEKNMSTYSPNAYSTTLFVQKGNIKCLFTGDIEGEGEQHLIEDIKENPDKFSNLTIFKVAHHGSMYTNSQELLELLNPRIALISCGIDNSYGHPHKELIERLHEIGTKIYRTDRDGEIQVSLNKNKLMVEVTQKE